MTGEKLLALVIWKGGPWQKDLKGVQGGFVSTQKHQVSSPATWMDGLCNIQDAGEGSVGAILQWIRASEGCRRTTPLL